MPSSKRLAHKGYDMILTHGANSIPRDSVVIDGTRYKTVKIGTQLWMAENLNSRFDFPLGTDKNPPRCSYYDGDESTYGKYGLLYNGYAIYLLSSASYKAQYFPNWHVPSTSEINQLLTFTGSSAAALKSATEWNGTDVYGFNALPSGYYNDSTYIDMGSYFWMGSSKSSFNSDTNYLALGSEERIYNGTRSKGCQVSIRLVHD